MKPDIAPAIETPAQARWVEDELVRSMMRTARNWQYISLLMAAVVVAVLWNDTPAWVLGTWATASVSVVTLRIWMLNRYAKLPALQQLEFFLRWRFLWPLSAFTGGLATGLFFDRASLAEQFVCWLFLAGMAMFSINTLASHLQTMRAYLHTMGFTALTLMLWRVGVELRFSGPTYHYWVIALLLMFWLALMQSGRRLHMTYRTNFELLYRNNQLIDSLTRQTQAALDAVEIKNRFLASAAHDIRQPVHALGLYADWLGSEPELVHEIAPKIVKSTKAVNALFDSLFDLARLDAGKIRLQVEPVDLPKLMHDLELQYRPLAEAKGLTLRMHLVPATAQSDPILLQRIVGNLIANALKYTERGGVLVACRAGSAGHRIEIWDTGVGIAPEHQREIFREFYKVPSHGTEEGFGLGLSIVERLAHILGHPLSLASWPGRGTRFRLVLLPTDAEHAADRAVATVAQLVNMP